MTPKIMLAINRYENALRVAVRRDVIAEINDTWEIPKLKACEQAWEHCKAMRVELEAAIQEVLDRGGTKQR